MGTRSVVAVPLKSGGWKGRYVHWDGYPEGVGRALAQIVQRDGYETAVKTLTQDHYGWSSLDPNAGAELDPGYTDGRFAAVEAYGVAYTTEQGQSSPDEWITPEGDDWGTEWAYVLHPDSIRVLERVGSGAFGWVHHLSAQYVDYESRINREETV